MFKLGYIKVMLIGTEIPNKFSNAMIHLLFHKVIEIVWRTSRQDIVECVIEIYLVVNVQHTFTKSSLLLKLTIRFNAVISIQFLH